MTEMIAPWPNMHPNQSPKLLSETGGIQCRRITASSSQEMAPCSA